MQLLKLLFLVLAASLAAGSEATAAANVSTSSPGSTTPLTSAQTSQATTFSSETTTLVTTSAPVGTSTAAPVTSSTGTPSTLAPTTSVPTPAPTFAPHAGMSHLSFYLLCGIVAATYYAILIISARAVGEGTATLMKPLTMLSRLASGLADCLQDVLRRRRGIRQYQALEFEDDEANAPTDGAVN